MNTYENAVPKPLKFLISDGKMIDDAGNVIAESETLKDLYTKWNPEVKKYLLSDGSVVDENNNLIVKNDYYKRVYEQADPKIAKYLHADGTIDENAGGGSGANLENNKTVTITENGTVEITPSAGYDGMKKVTAEVSVSGGAGDNQIFGDLEYNGASGSSITDSDCDGSWFHALVFDNYVVENPETHEEYTVNGIYIPEKYAYIDGSTFGVSSLSLTSTQMNYLLNQINTKFGTSFSAGDVGTEVPLFGEKVNNLSFCMFDPSYIPYLISSLHKSGKAYAVFVYNKWYNLSSPNANTFAMTVMHTF